MLVALTPISVAVANIIYGYNFVAPLNYLEHFLILPFAVTGCVSISAFTSLVCTPKGITIAVVITTAVVIKICAITGRIKKY